MLKYVSELLEAEKKFLVFAHHRSVMTAVREQLAKDKVGHIVIDGNTPGEHR